jgi:7-cyano-7-deazaguanine synthase
LAASYAEQIGADRVYVGFNAVDYSGYPDCRPEFVDAMNMAMTAGMKAPAKVYAPIIAMTKAEIIQTALALGVPIKHTWSCYNPIAHKGLGERPCGGCDSCIIRSSAFATLGINDPALEVS